MHRPQRWRKGVRLLAPLLLLTTWALPSQALASKGHDDDDTGRLVICKIGEGDAYGKYFSFRVEDKDHSYWVKAGSEAYPGCTGEIDVDHGYVDVSEKESDHFKLVD